jgi:hypothetical protein
MKCRTTIFFLFMLLGFVCPGQQMLTIVDAESLQPIQSASCLNNSKLLARSNVKGTIVLKKEWEGKLLQIVAFGYQDTTFVLSHKTTSIALHSLAYDLPEVSISPNNEPKLEWASNTFHIYDFAFIQNAIVILAFEKEKRWKSQEFKGKTLLQGCALIALDQHCNPLDTVLIADGAWIMNKEWDGHVLLDGPACYEVKFESGFELREISRSDYESYWSNVRLTTEQFTYVEEGSDLYPEREFRWIHEPTGSSKVLCAVRDTFSLELMRSEWKYLAPHDKVTAMQYESDLGIDKEIVSAFMTGFQETHYYEPVHAQLFPREDELLIVDRTNNSTSVYTRLGTLKLKVPFNVRVERGWEIENDFLLDDKTCKVYAVSHKQGVARLYLLNVETGLFSVIKSLTYRNVETIQVENDKVYYTYRVFESDEKLRLYSESINE